MIVLNDVIRVVITWLLTNDDFAQTVLHFTVTGALPADDQAWIDLITDWISDGFGAESDVMSDEVDINEVNIAVLNQGTGEFDPVLEGAASGFSGGSVSSMLPHGAAAVLERFTSNPRSTGRIFMPGLPSGGQADGQITAGFLADLVTVVTRFASTYAGTGGVTLTPLTYSRGTGTTNIMNGNVRVSALPGYQRRRKPGVGL